MQDDVDDGPEEAGAARPGSVDPGVSDWLWAVSFDDDDDREMTSREVVAALKSGDIAADTIVWREGMGDWRPVREVEEFAEVVGIQPGIAAHAGDGATAPGASPRDGSDPDEIPDDALDPPPDSREAWRKSTADLLASLGHESRSVVGAAVGAEPVAPHPEPVTRPPSARPASEAPRPALPSLRPSLIPRRGPGRIVAFAVVGLLVVLAVAGVVVLAVYGLAPEDDPTLGAKLPGSASAVQAKAARGSAQVAKEASAGRSPATAPIASSSADLASAISESLGPGGDEEPVGPKFDRKTAEQKLADSAARASACRPKHSEDQQGPAKVQVTFDPETGGVKLVRVLGRYSGTETGKCIRLTMKAIHIKKFVGEPVMIEQSVMVR